LTRTAHKRRRSRVDRGLGARPRSPRLRDLIAEVKREAEPLLEWSVRKELANRPRTRRECEPCAVCQAYADRVREEYQPHRAPQRPAGGGLEVLPCGHRAQDALNHCRPCPFVGCEHHLYLDVEDGHLRYMFPDREVDQLAETCSLDVAMRGAQPGEQNGQGAGWNETAALVNLTGEGMRLMKKQLLVQIRKHAPRDDDDE
jgi:hypothetical protein